MKGLTRKEYEVLSSTLIDEACCASCATARHYPYSFTLIAIQLAERGLVTIHDCEANEEVCHSRITTLGLEAKRIYEAIEAKL